MSAALPTNDPCCLTSCEDVLVQNIPGPDGDDGDDGNDGTDGVSAVTTIAVDFPMPAELGSDIATVESTAGRTIGETVYVQGLGTLQVIAISSAVLMTLKNLEDAATSAYATNAAPGTVAAIGSRVSPTGMQGPAGLLSGSTAGGDLKGIYPNPKLLIPNALGALAVGNGTDAVSLSAGTAGFVPVNDATTFPATGLGHKKILPVTGDTNVATDRLARLSAATGLPIPLTASKASLKDPGGLGLLVADATTGNARGTDAVDLQVTRTAVTAVASGVQSVISGGQDNTASGVTAVVAGGQENIAAGAESVVGGGFHNQVDAKQSVIAGGVLNTISGASPNEAAIGGGRENIITGFGQSVIAGGISNAVSSQYGAILGGLSNIASADLASIAGGTQATADKYGQRAFSAGRFAVQADCQQSDLLWRITTTNATIAEAFLDGASLRATIAVGRSIAFDFLIIGRSSAGVSAAWKVVGAIQNNAGTTALVAAVTTTVIADGTGASWGVAGGVTIDADDANDTLRVRVTGALATTIRWAIHGRLMELSH